MIVIDVCIICGEDLGSPYRVRSGHWIICQRCVDMARYAISTIETISLQNVDSHVDKGGETSHQDEG